MGQGESWPESTLALICPGLERSRVGAERIVQNSSALRILSDRQWGRVSAGLLKEKDAQDKIA